MTVRTAIRGYPFPSAIAYLVDHFRDSSYGNDSTDSIAFAIGGYAYLVWVGPVDPRDYTDEQPEWRFTVCALARVPGSSLIDTLDDRDVQEREALFETDDPAELIMWVRSKLVEVPS